MPNPIDALAHTLLKAATRPAEDRTERFMKRVDIHVANIPAADGARFCRQQARKWRENYVAWAERIDSGTASDTDLQSTAFDWMLTITALDKRATELEAKAEESAS